MIKLSSEWTLAQAKEVIQDIKDQAHYEYKWTVSKEDIEAVIMQMDYERYMYNSLYIAAIEATDEIWKGLKEAASRTLWLDMIREEVEKKDNTKKQQEAAI